MVAHIELLKGGDRRQRVRKQLAVDGNNAGPLRQVLELFERGGVQARTSATRATIRPANNTILLA